MCSVSDKSFAAPEEQKEALGNQPDARRLQASASPCEDSLDGSPHTEVLPYVRAWADVVDSASSCCEAEAAPHYLAAWRLSPISMTGGLVRARARWLGVRWA